MRMYHSQPLQKVFRLYALRDPQINLPCHKHSFDHKPCFETRTPRFPSGYGDSLRVHKFQVRTISGIWFVFFVFFSCVVISVSSETEGKCISHFAIENLGKNRLTLTFPKIAECIHSLVPFVSLFSSFLSYFLFLSFLDK